jgi:hypothetical protein
VFIDESNILNHASLSRIIEFPCRCWVEGDPMAETFDKTIKLIIDPQTTLLSRGQNPDRYDRCRYEVTAETDDNYPSKHGQVSSIAPIIRVCMAVINVDGSL